MSWWDDEEAGEQLSSSPALPPAAPDPLDALPTGPTAAARSIVNIFGRSGMGKTLLMASMYQGAIARGVSSTWIDSTGNNTYLARAGRSSGYLCAVVRSVEGWVAHIRRALRESRPWNVIVIPECDMLPFWSIAYDVGHQLVAIDEAEQFAPATARLEKHPLGKVLSQGRNRQLSMFSTVRLPPELHGRFKGNADVTISFRQQYRSYAEIIARECMHEADPRLVSWLERLPRFQYIRYDVNGRLTQGRTRPPAPRP